MKTSQYVLIFVLVLSILANVFLFFALGVNEIDWEYRYNQNHIQWCEIVNDHGILINDLLTELQYYGDTYDDIEYLDQLDCWGDYGEEVN